MFTALLVICDSDRLDYLCEALESLRLQTLPASEIVIILNGPVSAKIKKVIDKYRLLLPLKLFNLAEKCGLASALNFGLKRCSYELVARVDPDDVNLPHRFEQQLKLMQETDVQVISGSSNIIDEKSEIVGRKLRSGLVSLNNLILANPVIHPSVMFRKHYILELGAYDESLKKSQDWDLWIRVIKNGGKILLTNSIVLSFRITTNTVARRKACQGDNRRILKKHFCLTPLVALAYVRSYAIEILPQSILKILKRLIIRQ